PHPPAVRWLAEGDPDPEDPIRRRRDRLQTRRIGQGWHLAVARGIGGQLDPSFRGDRGQRREGNGGDGTRRTGRFWLQALPSLAVENHVVYLEVDLGIAPLLTPADLRRRDPEDLDRPRIPPRSLRGLSHGCERRKRDLDELPIGARV